MSDNRKILVAKRKEQRSTFNEPSTRIVKNNKQDDNSSKRGIKRPIPSTPKKNLANDRLKKLRTFLNEEVKQPSNTTQDSMRNVNAVNKGGVNTTRCSTRNARKRPPGVSAQDVSVTKVSRESVWDSPVLHSSLNENSVLTVSQKNIFTVQNTATSQSFAASNSLEFNTNYSSEETMEWLPGDDEQPSTISSTNLDDYNKLNTIHADYFYIVVDTNIFMSHMSVIKSIIEMNITGIKKPVIYIPWIVIEELDFIKDDSNKKSSLKWKAQEAIKYIEKTLTEKNERMMGQSLDDANEQKDIGKGQDNKIISCCLQVLSKYQNMILLTDDINLRNKAHINKIPACSHKEIVIKIPSSQTKSQIILGKMTSLCGTVIRECAERAYGDACNKMPICQSIPQTMQDCIKIFNKYWFPVFQDLLLKQCRKSITDLSSFLIDNSIIKDGSKELDNLLGLCTRICIFFKDIDSCKGMAENTIREMNNVKKS